MKIFITLVILLQTEDGNIFDCVDIYKQPAFDHPLLKNHTIQVPRTPSLYFIVDIKKQSLLLLARMEVCNILY